MKSLRGKVAHVVLLILLLTMILLLLSCGITDMLDSNIDTSAESDNSTEFVECAACGEETEKSAKFCPNCGGAMDSTLAKPNSNTNSNNSKKCLMCNNSVSRKDTPYCSTHDCMYGNCSRLAKCRRGCEWSSACEIHSCRYGDCLSIPPVNGYYCGAHDN